MQAHASAHASTHASIHTGLIRGRRRACVHSGSVRSDPATLLSWATEQSDSHVVAIRDLPSPKTRGLVAVTDIAEQQVILSVPYNKIYKSKPESELELHWSVDMALSLIKDKQRCQQGEGSWCEWLDTLPSNVLTPLEFTEQEICALGDPGMERQVRELQECVQASYYEVLQEELQALGPCTFEDFRSTVQVLHSRCFMQPEGRHLAVPGIDMANHSATPNAQVGVQHSPEAVQGLAAIAEVCDVSTLPYLEPSRFQLIATTKISAGDEISISYGAHWPDQAFLSLFGFIPEGKNKGNAAWLFSSMEEFVSAYMDFVQPPDQLPAEDLGEQIRAALGDRCVDGLFVIADGVDGRLLGAWQVLEESLPPKNNGSRPSLQALLHICAKKRVKELQAIEESRLKGVAETPGLSLANAYRRRQLDLLLCFLRNTPSS